MAANTQNGEEKTNESGASAGTVYCESAEQPENLGATGKCERLCNLSE